MNDKSTGVWLWMELFTEILAKDNNSCTSDKIIMRKGQMNNHCHNNIHTR